MIGVVGTVSLIISSLTSPIGERSPCDWCGGTPTLIIISLTSPVGAGSPCDWCGGDLQSDYIISPFTHRCEEPLQLVWWGPSV